MRFVFVGGSERSGTTLLQKILCSHSKIVGGPEFVFTSKVFELYRIMSGKYPEPYAARLDVFCTTEKLDLAFRRFYSSFFDPFLEQKRNAVYIADKTPSNITVADTLLKIFPDARFVHMVRDGRDVLASHRDVRKRLQRGGTTYNKNNFRLRRVCGRWNRAVETHFRLANDRLLAQRYHCVRYEDLLLDPRSVLESLFSFMALDLEERALKPEAIRSSEMGIPVDGYWNTEEQDRNGFDPTRINRWRRDLSIADSVVANLLMGPGLKALAYPITANWRRRFLPPG